jgi:hypothetical protein
MSYLPGLFQHNILFSTADCTVETGTAYPHAHAINGRAHGVVFVRVYLCSIKLSSSQQIKAEDRHIRGHHIEYLHVVIPCLQYLLTYAMALVRKRTIPTERPPLVGEVSANFCG